MERTRKNPAASASGRKQEREKAVQDKARSVARSFGSGWGYSDLALPCEKSPEAQAAASDYLAWEGEVVADHYPELFLLSHPDPVKGRFHVPKSAVEHLKSVTVAFRAPAQSVSRAEHDALRARVERLERLLPAEPEEDSYEVDADDDDGLRWIRSHAAELVTYQGKHVAIDPEDGVIASDTSYVAVYEQVKKLGRLEQALITRVPEA